MKYIIGIAIGILIATGTFYAISELKVEKGEVTSKTCGLSPENMCEFTFEGLPGYSLVDYYTALGDGALVKHEPTKELQVVRDNGKGLQANTLNPQIVGHNW